METNKEDIGDRSCQHSRTLLKLSSTAPSFQPPVFEDLAEAESRIVAVLVGVLG
jgi:hypothetical protein